jgi:hypothetical protein
VGSSWNIRRLEDQLGFYHPPVAMLTSLLNKAE